MSQVPPFNSTRRAIRQLTLRCHGLAPEVPRRRGDVTASESPSSVLAWRTSRAVHGQLLPGSPLLVRGGRIQLLTGWIGGGAFKPWCPGGTVNPADRLDSGQRHMFFFVHSLPLSSDAFALKCLWGF